MKKITCLILSILITMVVTSNTYAASNSFTLRSVVIPSGGGGSDLPIPIVQMGGEIVKHIGTVKHTFTAEESRNAEIAESTALALLGALSGGTAYLLTITRIITKYKTVNVSDIGGIYTKKYYVRVILDPSQRHLNVPVPYQFKWVTIFYDSPTMSDDDIVYTQSMNDGSPRLASN
ncbi:hypothetical protein AN1V17_36950 [Vallitalea sediminicola]